VGRFDVLGGPPTQRFDRSVEAVGNVKPVIVAYGISAVEPVSPFGRQLLQFPSLNRRNGTLQNELVNYHVFQLRTLESKRWVMTKKREKRRKPVSRVVLLPTQRGCSNIRPKPTKRGSRLQTNRAISDGPDLPNDAVLGTSRSITVAVTAFDQRLTWFVIR